MRSGATTGVRTQALHDCASSSCGALSTLRYVASGGEQQDYRSYVGPTHQYDLIGAAQFALLYALGLREHHRLLDIGCGSLRAGRMLISYLAPGGYTGVDPQPVADQPGDRP